MQCPSCATELLHAANFCPVCGTQLEAAAPPGLPVGAPPAIGQEPPHVVLPPREVPPLTGAPRGASDDDDGDNVVYLHPHDADPNAVPHGSTPGGLAANPHAANYSADPGQQPAPPTPLIPGPGANQPTQLHQAPQAGHQSPVRGVRSDDKARPAADTMAAAASSFFDGGDQAFWHEQVDRDPRVLGFTVALGATAALLGSITWYGVALGRGYGGAEAGGLVLVSGLLWIWYLSLPSEQQHTSVLHVHDRLRSFVDNRIDPLQHRTRARLVLRRERDRYRSMRNERTRRVTELGEVVYRKFRTGALDPELQAHAQRVMAIEQQMLMQDSRLQQLHEGDAPDPS